MEKKINKFIYWAPRILAILFVLFLALFSLDVFEENYGFWGTIAGLLMHNIPAFILLAIVVISWKHELVGAIAFILAGLLYVLMTFRGVMSGLDWRIALAWSLQIAGLAFLVGILFLIGWLRKKK